MLPARPVDCDQQATSVKTRACARVTPAAPNSLGPSGFPAHLSAGNMRPALLRQRLQPAMASLRCSDCFWPRRCCAAALALDSLLSKSPEGSTAASHRIWGPARWTGLTQAGGRGTLPLGGHPPPAPWRSGSQASMPSPLQTTGAALLHPVTASRRSRGWCSAHVAHQHWQGALARGTATGPLARLPFHPLRLDEPSRPCRLSGRPVDPEWDVWRRTGTRMECWRAGSCCARGWSAPP